MEKEGHRKRLRDKFLKSGLEALHDYEIIELLLTLGTPRKDCKQQAKEAIKKFKSFNGVLESSLEELQIIKGVGSVNAFGIKLFQAVASKYLKEKVLNERSIINSPKVIYDYLQIDLQKEKKEVFKVFYLNNANKVLAVEDIFEGTTDQAIVYPREIVKSALSKNASRLIFAHNHPSGESYPSPDDLEITKRLKKSCETVEIEVLDHIIIGEGKYYSFCEHNLL